MNHEEICLKERLCIYLYIFIYLLRCVNNVLFRPFFGPSSVGLRPSDDLALPEARVSGGACVCRLGGGEDLLRSIVTPCPPLL